MILGGSVINAAPVPSKGHQQTRHSFTVIIDAGHGGHDIGATDNGIREKDVNLGVALKLAEMLGKERKDIKVVMTRSKDEFISLQERADIANRNRGDLFVSIHTNSVDRNNRNRRTVQGASVYALGLHKDADNLKVAQRENSVIELESNYEQKYSGFDPLKDESYIIFEMAQKRNLGHSLKFAGEAQKQLVGIAGRADRGVKQAGFWVLWATSMPAVLVELDFICNPQSAKFIGSKSGQEQMAKALFNAVETYEASVNHGNTAVKVTEDAVKTQVETNDIKSEQHKQKTEKSKKNKKKHSRRDESANVAGAATVVDEVAEEAVPVLVSTTTAPRQVRSSAPKPDDNSRSYNYADARKRTLPVGQRKRRSASSRKVSDSRDITGDAIVLRSENAFLAQEQVTAAKKTESVVAKAEPEEKQKESKKKKGKKNVRSNDTGDKSNNNQNIVKTKGGVKHIYVSSNGQVSGNNGSSNEKTENAVVANAENKPRRHTSLAGRRNRNSNK